MDKNEKIQRYERFFHAINIAIISGNDKIIQKAIVLIDNWSYAHRRGNGELSYSEQKRLIDNACRKFDTLWDVE